MPAGTLVLASTSPRRRRLLAEAGFDFEVVDPGPDGPSQAVDPAARVLDHARAKALAGARLRPGRPVLAADTLVVLDGAFLPQPSGRREAEAMLRRLSGRRHEVWTGTVLILPDGGRREAADRARVRFRTLAPTELATYLDGGEWRGKAGAYAIQGAAGAWAEVEEGSLDTVVGLCLDTVRRLLGDAGACPEAPVG
ncbi:MAG: septum formation protein Maf [Planctomycetota bacterium]|nr:MAG: septum formation protein Maf [Planctomycetota bacterium]